MRNLKIIRTVKSEVNLIHERRSNKQKQYYRKT